MNDRYHDLERFTQVWQALHDEKQPTIPAHEVKISLDRHYAEKERFYHNTTHINHGLLELDKIRSTVYRPSEVEIAWYFHDAIYNPKAKDNEEKSADLAREFLFGSGVQLMRTQRVIDAILATKHTSPPASHQECILVDIDLAILGSERVMFDEYETNIRKEYEWVPEEQFRKGRGDILKMFLQKPAIYTTPFFIDTYEEQARKNLQYSIEKLSA